MLLQELNVGRFAEEFLALDVKKLRKPLRHLDQLGFLESGSAEKENADPGPPPIGCRLAEDSKTITWHSTARLVIELFHHAGSLIDEAHFIAEMTKLEIPSDDTGMPLTSNDITDQVAYCIRKGFVGSGVIG
jgi:hypothetical protein